MANLSPEQLAKVEQWAAEGGSLNDVQSRLKSEFDITLTYLEARLLMLDVGVRIKDKPRELPKPEEPAPAADFPEDVPEDFAADEAPLDVDDPSALPSGGTITLTADQITAPGALISGSVTFSDGQVAKWSLDQMGRLGLGGAPQGYQPPKGDIPQFQQQLDLLMQRAGF
jgi:hypothetical protein